MNKLDSTRVQAWARRHRITLTAVMIGSRSAPCTPTGEYQTWHWAATTARGSIEFEGETDGSGPHDAFTHLFAVWNEATPDPAEFAAVVEVLGPHAVAELAGWELQRTG